MEPPGQSAHALAASQQQQHHQSDAQQSHPELGGNLEVEPNAAMKPAASNPAPSAASPATSFLDFSGPRFPQLSASTTEILKRMKENPAAMQGWEAAREQVLKRMVTSHNMPTPPLSAPSRGGRGRGRGRSLGSPAARGTIKVEAPATASILESPVTPSLSGRGRGRGRGGAAGRGSGGRGRGGKRKRGRNYSDDESDGSDLSDYTPLPTKTNSGRHIHRPTHFTPASSTPTNPNSMRGRRGYRRTQETTVCKICLRGPSPTSNMIVFCDSCNAPYHQLCHDPPISPEVVRIPEREWLCSTCAAPMKQTTESKPVAAKKSPPPAPAASVPTNAVHRVSGDDLTNEQKRTYLATLPHAHLVDLLLHAVTLHPSLPLFPARSGDTKTSLANAVSGLNSGNEPSVSASLSSSSLANTTTTTSATTQNSNAAFSHPQDADPKATAAATNGTEQDLIQESDEGDLLDPPYPKAGNGLPFPPESDDIAWLIDDSVGVFSHSWRDGDGEDGELLSHSHPLSSGQAAADAVGTSTANPNQSAPAPAAVTAAGS